MRTGMIKLDIKIDLLTVFSISLFGLSETIFFVRLNRARR